MNDVKIAWAMHRGALVSVEDVPSGLAADCTCPECGRVLVARRGPDRTHHFAHHEGAADCPLAAPGSGGSDATSEARHRLAVGAVRQVLSTLRSIELPGGEEAEVLERHLAERHGGGLVVDRILVARPNTGREADSISFALEITATGRLGSQQIERLRSLGLDALLLNVTAELVIGQAPEWLRHLITHGCPRYWRRYSQGLPGMPAATLELDELASPAAGREPEVRAPAILLSPDQAFSTNYPMRALKNGRPLPYDITWLRKTGLPLYCPVQPKERVTGGVLDIPPNWLKERAIRLSDQNAVMGPPVAYELRFDGPVALHDANATLTARDKKKKLPAS